MSVAHIIIANAQEQLQDYTQAITTYEKLLSFCPNHAEALCGQIELFCILAINSDDSWQTHLSNAILTYRCLLKICECDFNQYECPILNIHADMKNNINACIRALIATKALPENGKAKLLEQIKLVNDLFNVERPLNQQRELAYAEFQLALQIEDSEKAIEKYEAALCIMNNLTDKQLNSNDNRFYMQCNSALGDIHDTNQNWRTARSHYDTATKFSGYIQPTMNTDDDTQDHCQQRIREINYLLDKNHRTAYGVPIPKPLQRALRNDPVAKLMYASSMQPK